MISNGPSLMSLHRNEYWFFDWVYQGSIIYVYKIGIIWNYLSFIKRICTCHTIDVCFRLYIKWFYSEFIVEFNKYYRWGEQFNYDDYIDLQRPFIYNLFSVFLVQIPYWARHWILFECPLIIFTINYDLFISCVVFVERFVRLQDEFTNVKYMEGARTLQTKLLNGNKTLILKSPWKSYFSINSI